MPAFFALFRKDLILFFSNRRALLMAIVAPIAISAFFGSLFGGGGDADRPAHVPIGVTDLDRSDASRRLVAALAADPALAPTEADAEANAAAVRAGRLRAALVLPAGFGQQAARALFGGRGAKPEVVLTVDPSQGMALGLVRGLLTQHVFEAVAGSVTSGGTPVFDDLKRQALDAPGLPDGRRRELVAMFDSIDRVAGGMAREAGGAGAAVGPAASGASGVAVAAGPADATSAAAGTPAGVFSMPVRFREVEASARPEAHYDAYAHSFAGMGVQFILLMGVDLGVGLLALRRTGLWPRLRAAPLSRATLLGSRVASTAAIAVVVFAIVWAVAIAAFGVRIAGSAVGFGLVLLAFAAVTGSFGLLIAALGRTPEATRGLAVLATLLLVMLGGAWVPAFLFPTWLQRATWAVPTRWAVEGFDAMTWRGLGIDAALAPAGAMLAFAAAFTGLAVWRFRWEE